MSHRAGVLRLAAPAAAAAVALAARAASADDTTDLQQLLDETVITTASKSAETGTTAPATSTTITAEDLRRYGIHSLDEALDFLSLGVWTSSNLVTTDVGARGVVLTQDQGSHFLLLVDGHAINEPLFGAARFDRGTGVPMEMIDHIEVILGPGSVLYGSNAMLGVVNVITKRARDWKGGHAVGEWEIGKSARAGAGVGWVLGESTELTLMLDYWRQYGPGTVLGSEIVGDDGATLRPFRFHPNASPSDGTWGGTTTSTPRAQVPSGLLRFVTGNFEIDVGAKLYERSTPYDPISFQGFAFYDDPDHREIDRHLWIDAKHHATLSPVVQLTSRLYADTYDYQRWADTASGADCAPYGATPKDGVPECRMYLLGISRWAGAELQASFDWLQNASLVTLVGADGRLRNVASKTDTLDYEAFLEGSTKNIRSSFGVIDRTDEIVGAYVEQTWRPAPLFGLNGGARLDFDPRFAPQVSPRVAASASPWHGGTFKAIYSTAFRAPTLGESLYANPEQIVAHDLRPETERSAEVSLEQKLVGAHKIVFGAFRTWWNDLIELHVLTQDEIGAAQQAGELSITSSNKVVQYRNVSSIDSYGFNGGVAGTNKDGALRYALNVTGASTTFDDGLVAPHPIAVAPRVFGNARVSYDLPGALPTVALAARWLGRRPADQAFEGSYPVPPFVAPQLGLRATVSGDVGVVRGMSYRAALDWMKNDVAPYVIGPNRPAPASTQETPSQIEYPLAPVDTFRVIVGLQWDFGS